MRKHFKGNQHLECIKSYLQSIGTARNSSKNIIRVHGPQNQLATVPQLPTVAVPALQPGGPALQAPHAHGREVADTTISLHLQKIIIFSSVLFVITVSALNMSEQSFFDNKMNTKVTNIAFPPPVLFTQVKLRQTIDYRLYTWMQDGVCCRGETKNVPSIRGYLTTTTTHHQT